MYLFYRIQKDFSMLKYVVFAVTEKERQVLDRSRAELEQVFTGEKTEFLIVSAAQTEEGILRLRMEESLILTDDPAYLKALQAAGFYTAGLHHKENQGTFFEGAAYVIEEIGEITFSVYDEIYRRLAGFVWGSRRRDSLHEGIYPSDLWILRIWDVDSTASFRRSDRQSRAQCERRL